MVFVSVLFFINWVLSFLQLYSLFFVIFSNQLFPFIFLIPFLVRLFQVAALVILCFPSSEVNWRELTFPFNQTQIRSNVCFFNSSPTHNFSFNPSTLLSSNNSFPTSLAASFLPASLSSSTHLSLHPSVNLSLRLSSFSTSILNESSGGEFAGSRRQSRSTVFPTRRSSKPLTSSSAATFPKWSSASTLWAAL